MVREYPIQRKIVAMGKVTVNLRTVLEEHEKKINEKLTVERMAYETKLAMNTVRAWLKGGINRIDTETLATFCDYLKCTPADIIHYEPN